MKIKDILIESAMLLGMDSVANDISSTSESTENELLTGGEVSRMFDLFKFSLREICVHYVPYIVTKQVQATDNCILLSSLNEFIAIRAVFKDGIKVKYKVQNAKIIVDLDGDYVVEYLTVPTPTSLFEEINFLPNCTPSMLIHGVCAYYSLSKGLFEEYETYINRFRELAEALNELHSFELPSRRWE